MNHLMDLMIGGKTREVRAIMSVLLKFRYLCSCYVSYHTMLDVVNCKFLEFLLMDIMNGSQKIKLCRLKMVNFLFLCF